MYGLFCLPEFARGANRALGLSNPTESTSLAVTARAAAPRTAEPPLKALLALARCGAG